MVVRSKSSSESEHWSDETDGNGVFEFKTVTVAFIGLVAAGIVAKTAVGAEVVAVVFVNIVVAFGFRFSFNCRFSLIFVVSFKFDSLAKLLLTSIVFKEFVFRTDIFFLSPLI